MKTRITFWVLISTLVILVVIQAFLKELAFERSIYFILLLIVFSWSISTKSVVGFRLERKSRESRQQVGQYFREHFEITNETNLPKLWVSVKDYSGIGRSGENRLIAWIPPKSKTSFQVQTQLYKRGNFVLGPTEIISGDPFGIFSKNVHIQSKEKLLVIPIFEKLSYFPGPTGLLTGGNARKTRHLEVSPFAISVREYAPGDPLRRVDWKSSARQNKLMVKEFEQDPLSNVWIVLDGESSSHFRTIRSEEEKNINTQLDMRTLERKAFSLPEDTFEYAVSFSAAIASFYLNDGKTLGFSSNSQQVIYLSPEKGERQLAKILEVLALVQAESGIGLSEFLETQLNKIQKGSTVVVISSAVSDNLINSIGKMKKRGILPIFVSINPATFGAAAGNEEIVNQMLGEGVFTISVNKGEGLGQKLVAS